MVVNVCRRKCTSQRQWIEIKSSKHIFAFSRLLCLIPHPFARQLIVYAVRLQELLDSFLEADNYLKMSEMQKHK
jgi:hypothetical protein